MSRPWRAWTLREMMDASERDRRRYAAVAVREACKWRARRYFDRLARLGVVLGRGEER
jgi:hypothetical protein